MTDAISSRSAYDAIAEVILARIRDGVYQGPALPTEYQLAEEFGVSRVTVNKAVSELSNMGVVEVRRGQGTFLVEPIRISASALRKFLRQRLGDGDILLLRNPRGGTRRVVVTDLEE